MNLQSTKFATIQELKSRLLEVWTFHENNITIKMIDKFEI